MFKNHVLPAIFAASLMVSGAAFAAGTEAAPTTKAPANVQQVSLTKAQKKEVEKQCKAEHKGDKVGFKACVKEKSAAPAETGKM